VTIKPGQDRNRFRPGFSIFNLGRNKTMFDRKSYSGSGAIAISLQQKQAYKLAEVRLTLSAATTDLGDFAVSLDSELGTAFNTVLCRPDSEEDLTVVTSFRYADPVPPIVFPGDVLMVAWPNTGTKTWAVEIIIDK
jgi:hypothetical protein